MTWDELRTRATRIAQQAGEWAGAPIPVSCLRMVVEPRYPYQSLNGSRINDADGERTCIECGDPMPPGRAADEPHVVNQWYSHRFDAEIVIYRDGGLIKHALIPHRHGRRLTFAINTMGAASEALNVSAELRAQETLRGMVTPQAMRCYQLAGAFLETSPRSKVTYLFRKGRPTVALRSGDDGNVRALCALCLHPIGYYERSYAGVMCPTDDVIAHVLMMRADERKFWAKANHHELYEAEAGI